MRVPEARQPPQAPSRADARRRSRASGLFQRSQQRGQMHCTCVGSVLPPQPVHRPCYRSSASVRASTHYAAEVNTGCAR
eukprot:15436705-Alexandrium_andersonii.AAC.1